MARESADREDLLREATALVERVEFHAAGFDEPIVAGFRRDGAASFYFGPEVVYQFNAAGDLRRGFLDGKLIKAIGGRLAALLPVRTATQTELRRHEFDEAETAEFIADMTQRLQSLANSLTTNSFQIVGQVPSETDVIRRVSEWLAALPKTIPIAGTARL